MREVSEREVTLLSDRVALPSDLEVALLSDRVALLSEHDVTLVSDREVTLLSEREERMVSEVRDLVTVSEVGEDGPLGDEGIAVRCVKGVEVSCEWSCSDVGSSERLCDLLRFSSSLTS